jgi:beta-lactamase regulating signal transducer with metallopeptidase domain
MEQLLVSFVLNAAWQLPLIAATVAAAGALLRPSARVEHWMWLAALLASVLLPMMAVLLARGGLPSADAVLPAASQPMAQVNDVPADAGGSIAALSVALTPMTAHVLIALCLGIAASLLAALLGSLLRVRRLVRSSRPLILPAPVEERLAPLCHLPRPHLRETDELDSPAVVGAVKPILLLPDGFCGRESDLVLSALLHELAHIARRDYALNLCCRWLFLAVGWHPVAWLIASAIDQSREAACDEAAAGGVGSKTAYAENLLTLARSLAWRAAPPPPAAAIGLLRHNLIEKRVKRLIAKRGRVTVSRIACVAVILSASAYASATIRIAPVYDAERAADRRFAPAPILAPPFRPFLALPLQRRSGLVRSRHRRRADVKTIRGGERLADEGTASHLDSIPAAWASDRNAPPSSASAGPAMAWDASRTAQFLHDMEDARRGAADASRPWQSGNLQRDMEAARRGVADAVRGGADAARGGADAARPWRSGDLKHEMQAARQGVADVRGTRN